MIVRLHRDNALAVMLLPQAMERIKAFCQRFDTDTKPEDLENLCWTLFSTKDIRLGWWVVCGDDLKMQAHLLATPEPLEWSKGWTHVLIRQAESDRKARVHTRPVMDEVKTWTAALQIPKIRFLTHKDPVAFARRWGATPIKTLLEIPVTGYESNS